MIINKERCIYEIRNIMNGKRYIGSTENKAKRWYQHQYRLENNSHSNKHLQRAWNKYGEENFVFSKLESVPANIDLLEEEQIFLDEENPEYNISQDARVSFKGEHHTEKTKQKIRENRRSYEGSNNPMYGKKRNFSAKTKQKMSEAAKGRKLTEETKQKLREAQTGRERSERTKQKISEAHKGKELSRETRRKMSKAGKGKNKGKKNNNVKLTAKKVKVIKHLFKGKHFTQEEIGKMFGVSQGAVADMSVGTTWNHVSIGR